MTRAPKPSTKQETSDDYGKVVAHLTDLLRVIACKDDIQWIFQQRVGGSVERPWKARSYCVTRKALIRVSAASGASNDALKALPDVFSRTPIKNSQHAPNKSKGDITCPSKTPSGFPLMNITKRDETLSVASVD